MKITTTYDNNGARTDKIDLTAEEEKAITAAVEIIKNRCIEAGYPKDYKDWDNERWRLLGIMRFESGINAVLKFANTAEISPYNTKKESRGYA